MSIWISTSAFQENPFKFISTSQEIKIILFSFTQHLSAITDIYGQTSLNAINLQHTKLVTKATYNS